MQARESRGGRAVAGFITAVVLLALLTVLPAVSAGRIPPDPDVYGPTFDFCNSFHAKGYRIDVYAKNVSCRRARNVQKAFWRGSEKSVIYHPMHGVDEYWTLKRFPGWRCTTGAGGGSCAKGRATAAYQSH
jgi:hypothetical protein